MLLPRSENDSGQRGKYTFFPSVDFPHWRIGSEPLVSRDIEHGSSFLIPRRGAAACLASALGNRPAILSIARDELALTRVVGFCRQVLGQ